MAQTVFAGEYPASGAAYPAVRVRVSVSTDGDIRPAARELADAVERGLRVNGSTLTYGDGRWAGAVESGATVETCAPVATYDRARLVAALRPVLARLGLSAFLTVEPVTAVELY